MFFKFLGIDRPPLRASTVIEINYQAYKTWFEFDLKGRPQQNPSGALLK